MPKRCRQFIAEGLCASEIREPAGVVGEFLVEKIFKIVGLDEVLNVGVFLWSDEAIF